jgi:hypothetical protein
MQQSWCGKDPHFLIVVLLLLLRLLLSPAAGSLLFSSLYLEAGAEMVFPNTIKLATSAEDDQIRKPAHCNEIRSNTVNLQNLSDTCQLKTYATAIRNNRLLLMRLHSFSPGRHKQYSYHPHPLLLLLAAALQRYPSDLLLFFHTALLGVTSLHATPSYQQPPLLNPQHLCNRTCSCVLQHLSSHVRQLQSTTRSPTITHNSPAQYRLTATGLF